MRDFYVLFLRKAHSTEHPSRGLIAVGEGRNILFK